KAQVNVDYSDIITTVVDTLCTDEFVTIDHVGDSRCYIYNDNGFSQLTVDHSLVNELLKSGEITDAEAREHPRKNIVLKALGTAEDTVSDVKSIEWETHNKRLLCTDGLTDKLTDEELSGYLENQYSIESKD